MYVITGAAGSWGQEFVKQLNELGLTIVGIDNNEAGIAALSRQYPNQSFVLGDFADYQFGEPATVIHLAAYKHIDLAEKYPAVYIENNVTKTAKLFEAAHQANADVLFISTDKAVEPISTYGFTKALGERLAEKYGFAIARTGNIVGSRGSVVEVWQKQVQEGQPVTITDKRMTRYFLNKEETISEIIKRFLNGERKIIVGEDKERRLIDFMHDYVPDDYPVVETGLRCTEKLHEKLKWDFE